MEMDTIVQELTEERKFLKKLVKILLRCDWFDMSIRFRVRKDNPYDYSKCDETTEYLDYEDIIKMFNNPYYHDKVYNYKEYSNLPQNCVLYTLDNVVHNGNLKYIYGYLDEKTKSFVKYEYDLTKDNFGEE